MGNENPNPRYFAQTDDTGIVSQVIVADDLEWCVDNLGGTWVETSDPYTPEPQTVTYAGIGMGCDETWPEKFAPQWTQPTGAHDAYPIDSLVFHNGRIWKNLIDANAHEPGVSGWRDTPDSGLPQWTQPSGAHDAYQIGDEVTHNGKNWRSTHANNVWEPGVFGWIEF